MEGWHRGYHPGRGVSHHLVPDSSGGALLLFGLVTLGLAGLLRWLFAPGLQGWTPKDLVRSPRVTAWTGQRCDKCGVFREDQSYYHHQVDPDGSQTRFYSPDARTVVLCSDCYEGMRDAMEKP